VDPDIISQCDKNVSTSVMFHMLVQHKSIYKKMPNIATEVFSLCLTLLYV